jgi:hypothetical protein
MPLYHDAPNAAACATRSWLPLQSRGVPCAEPMSLAPHGHREATFLHGNCFESVHCCSCGRLIVVIVCGGVGRATREDWPVRPWREC